MPIITWGATLARWSLLIFLVISSSCKSSKATYYVVFRSPDAIAVAIDSRLTITYTGQSSDEHSDYDCKIHLLSNHLFFFYTGTGSGGGAPFNATQIVDDIFSRSSKPIDIYNMSKEWGERSKIAFNHYYQGKRIFIYGNFIGTNQDDNITAYISRVGPNKEGIIYETETRPVENSGAYSPDHDDIAQEFIGPSLSPRAKELFDQVSGTGKIDDFSETARSMAVLATSWVAGMIRWADDPGIGGQVATVVIERGHAARWFRQPPFCQAIPN